MADVMWDQDSALNLIRAIQTQTKKYGYHIALGGNVLTEGQSDDTLELYFLPFMQRPKDPDGLVKWLGGLWGSPGSQEADYEEDEVNNPFAPILQNDGPPLGWQGYLNPKQQLIYNKPKPKANPYKYQLVFKRPATGDIIEIWVAHF